MERELAPDQQMFHFIFMISAKSATIIEEKGHHFLMLKQADPKALFMTARPGRMRAFIPNETFINNWIHHNDAYLSNPPHVAIIHSGMVEDSRGVAQAIRIGLSNPHIEAPHVWKFDLEFLSEPMTAQEYHEITLFIDWTPALVCPEPIRVQVPSLIKKA